ncbi:MAG: type IV pilus secretin PilQ [Deltaproteobacteria bacterium]|nr:type IV pilus secretin PilQ [Deltaproteobacteria bacterium]
MILKKHNNKKAGVGGYRLLAIGYGLWVLPIAYCLLSIACSVAEAEIYNNIKARIEGDTTVFTIEVKDAELKDVLRALAKQNNLNIIVGEDIAAKATFSLDKITFKDALEIITKTNGLSYVIQNNVLWIGKKDSIAKTGEDIIMEMVQLNYAKASDVAGNIKGVLSEKGSAVSDSRTNSLILRDAKKNIEDAKLLIKSLDTRTMQVVIEARIIEVQNNFARDLGVQWGAAGGTAGKNAFTTGFGSTATAPSNTVTPSGFIGSGGRFATQPNFAVNLPAAGVPVGALGLAFGKLTGDPLLLDLRISAGERSGQLKIVSQPKVTTLNNTAATIHSGLNFKVRTSTTTTTTGAATATGTISAGLEDVKTGIDLTVTPRISSDDFIYLNIIASKSDPDFARSVDGIPGVSEKRASTSVLVKDGETTVIGGLYKSTASDADNSIPYLSKIPILGWLFKSNSKIADNEELLVFITPRIVKYDSQIDKDKNNPMEVKP